MSVDFPPNTEFLDLWQEKMFLGREFLTWLWLTSEMDNRFPGPGGSAVELTFERKLVLETGLGQNRSQVVCQNPDHDWTEAFVALGVYKTVTRAIVRLRTDVFECCLSLPADTLSPQSVKIVTGAEFTDDDEAPLNQAGHFLNQVSLVSQVKTIIDVLYRHFLTLRLSDDWTAKELPRLRDFLEPKMTVPVS
ncbi:MAG: hypothetical protein LBP22_00230 [Deltaproteobacteria bacterium]|nr:hypothetical protein [Deltaproteobacteria bacterium]